MNEQHTLNYLYDLAISSAPDSLKLEGIELVLRYHLGAPVTEEDFLEMDERWEPYKWGDGSDEQGGE